MPLLLTESGGYVLLEDSTPAPTDIIKDCVACRTADRVYDFGLDNKVYVGQGIAGTLRFTTNPAADISAATFALYVSSTPDKLTAVKTYTPTVAPDTTAACDVSVDFSDTAYTPGNTYYGSLYADGSDLLAEIAIVILNTAMDD